MVSIITVNYNGLSDTCEMIDSFLKNETYPYEIIVVDNGSQSPQAEKIKKQYPDKPQIKVVQNINNGFAGGNNAGLKVAEGDYLFFINNDAFITGPILKKLVHRLKDRQNGGVSPMLKYGSNMNVIQFAGFTPLSPITLRNRMIGEREPDHGQYSSPREIPYLHGAAMMVRRDVLQRVGPMTDIFFLFYEEIDWSVRMRRAGYRLWYEPASVVYHKESMTAQRGTPLREFYMSRARVLFARRNLDGMRKLLACFYICLLASPKKAICHLLHGQFKLSKATLCGTFSGITAQSH
ncbi:glycosyltransferase family 2 protein [Bacteroides fluxus]|uniref:glycosyltransferase family 2 protein n=1 Tax=Bacteroides fluxus TaxID=626930 RepID=UPI002354627D|nr:glycosyltransferase family 2 protein [Bacteroides fluxus]